MLDTAGFLVKLKAVEEANERKIQVMFEEFLSQCRSLEDLVEIWKSDLNQEQAKQVFHLFRKFLTTEVAGAMSLETLDAIWHPIWNLPFRGDNAAFRVSDLDDIYQKRKAELENQRRQ